ncbi:beta-ketoacyl synthase N-terminal-like domain-containing protein [Mycobacterium simulans]|uniref:beta-ketoacyl synthase N-terminal-like domain-containing protein n=1 Tax=Mycobacterium simulans TaxID=627089 RepID=UPI001C8FC45D
MEHGGGAGPGFVGGSAGCGGGDFVAIVGMACRFPGASDLSGLWCLLRDGVDAVDVVPRGRGIGVGHTLDTHNWPIWSTKRRPRRRSWPPLPPAP